jgi:ComF family protein
LLQSFKYRGRLALARFFAASLAARIAAPVDLVLPMPLHRQRLAERGFNQAAEIARELSGLLGIPAYMRCAQRTRNTRSQTDLAFSEREGNVRGAFACNLDVAGKRVAVIDDIMTTGATLNALALALKRAGAIRVENWVVARTLLD